MGTRIKDVLSSPPLPYQSNQEINQFIFDQCDKHLESFKSKIIEEDIPNGIRTIEAFPFCALAKYYDVDIIIESGVKHGKSTLIWAIYFPDINIIAIDSTYLKATKEKIYNINHYYNVRYMIGLSQTIIYSMIDLFIKYTGRKVAVFIDGPKGHEALNLASIIYNLECVKLVGIHDMHPTNYPDAYKELEQWNVKKFASYDPAFLERYAHRFEFDNDKPNSAVYIFK